MVDLLPFPNICFVGFVTLLAEGKENRSYLFALQHVQKFVLLACRDVPLAVYLCTGKIAADHENTAAVLLFSILKAARRCFLRSHFDKDSCFAGSLDNAC